MPQQIKKKRVSTADNIVKVVYMPQTSSNINIISFGVEFSFTSHLYLYFSVLYNEVLRKVCHPRRAEKKLLNVTESAGRCRGGLCALANNETYCFKHSG